jgi:hexosaminidase
MIVAMKYKPKESKMKSQNKFFFVLITVLLFTVFLDAKNDNKVLNLMPIPVKVELTGSKFRLDSTFRIEVTGKPAERIYAAVSRTLRRLSGRTGIFLSQDYIQPNSSVKNPAMIINVERQGIVKLNEDESYKLDVTDRIIRLTAVTDLCAIRGMETFLQLLDADSLGYFFPTVKIVDYPRFPWRGLMIDVSRHFMPVDVIKRNLDGMAALKMNVFHWHLSDDQGFRVESKAFPKLTEMGSDGLFYTQAQIKDIIKYADDRGIRVIPEFDLPGHSTSWFVGYPQYASAFGPYSIERKFGQFDPTFDPSEAKTYLFLDKFFEEMSKLFPDEYIHIGGDENNGKQWDANKEIQAFMKKHHIPDNRSLQSFFNKKLLAILTKYHKKMIGWDEILNPDMPKDIVIQSWRGTESLKNAAEKGYHVILSNGYYLDLCLPASYHYAIDPEPDSLHLNSAQQKYIIGGEACMWSEFVSPETIDSRIWPRAAAIAERLWSPKSVISVKDMYRRLYRISLELEDLGLTHIKNQDMMIRRLANYGNVEALTNLIKVIEPVKNYDRFVQEENFTSYYPLTRVVDASVPDPQEPRYFAGLVNDLTQKQANNDGIIKKIERLLMIWRDNDKQLEKTINRSPMLKEVEPISKELSLVSSIGLQAINYIAEDKKADDGWVKESLMQIKKSDAQAGHVELKVVQPIEDLIQQAGKINN